MQVVFYCFYILSSFPTKNQKRIEGKHSITVEKTCPIHFKICHDSDGEFVSFEK